MLRLALLISLLGLLGCGSEEPLEVSGVSLAPESTRFAIAWNITRPGFSRVQIWKVSDPQAKLSSTPRELPGVEFRAQFTPLDPDTEYAYQIGAGPTAQLDDPPFATPVATFRTRPQIAVADVTVDVTHTSALVRWRTARPTDSTVAYGRTEELEARKANPLETAATEHSVTLPGLEPGRTYYVKVLAADAQGQAPLSVTRPRAFTTPRRPGVERRIMPLQGPRSNTLTNLSNEYLKRLTRLSAKERQDLEAQIQSQSPDERIELSVAEKAELAKRADPADADGFRRKVDLIQRWIIHLGQKGQNVEHLGLAAVTLANRHFVAPAQAVVELERVVAELSRADL